MKYSVYLPWMDGPPVVFTNAVPQIVDGVLYLYLETDDPRDSESVLTVYGPGDLLLAAFAPGEWRGVELDGSPEPPGIVVAPAQG